MTEPRIGSAREKALRLLRALGPASTGSMVLALRDLIDVAATPKDRS